MADNKQKKTSMFLVLAVLLWAALCFGKAHEEGDRYACMRDHYPDRFIEITMETPNSESEDVGLYDRGKAIYRRTYVYENIRYSTKINAKEFDDTFYICPDNPSQEFSETDIRHMGERQVFSIVYIIIGTMSFIWCFVKTAGRLKTGKTK